MNPFNNQIHHFYMCICDQLKTFNRHAVVIVSLATISFSYGQDENYALFTQKADSLYAIKHYKEAAKSFENAFASLDGKAYPFHRYNAACCHALSKNKKKAFFHLDRLVNGSVKYNQLEHISTDSDLASLHNSKKWSHLLEATKANKDAIEKNYNWPLKQKLDSIYHEDQQLRQQLPELERKYGQNTPEINAHWKLINEKDSLNLIQVRNILEMHGWLGADIVGPTGNQTLFLVIQHSDIETQLNYLPMMREAVANNKANASSLALLEDRVALGTGHFQIYGSQIGINNDTGEKFVLPLSDPAEVDARREKIGLSNMQEYTSLFGFNWNTKAYIEKLPEIEAYWRKNWNK